MACTQGPWPEVGGTQIAPTPDSQPMIFPFQAAASPPSGSGSSSFCAPYLRRWWNLAGMNQERWVWPHFPSQLLYSNTLPASYSGASLWFVALRVIIPLCLSPLRSPELWRHYPCVFWALPWCWTHLPILMIWSLCLPVTNLPPCLPLCQINQIWAWKELPKGPETPASDVFADSEHNPFFGGSFGGRCQYRITLSVV